MASCHGGGGPALKQVQVPMTSAVQMTLAEVLLVDRFAAYICRQMQSLKWKAASATLLFGSRMSLLVQVPKETTVEDLVREVCVFNFVSVLTMAVEEVMKISVVLMAMVMFRLEVQYVVFRGFAERLTYGTQQEAFTAEDDKD